MPQAIDASVNTQMPITYHRRRPCRSASVAAVMMNIAMPRLYAATTHCRPASPTLKLSWIDGSATFTISASRKIMNRPSPVATRVMRCVRSIED